MTITKALLLIVGAPMAPVFVYVFNEGYKSPSVIVNITLVSYALGLVTFLISLIACKRFTHSPKTGVVTSIIISEIVYLAILLVYMLVIDEKNKAENMMWLPVMIIFAVPFTLPMPIAISHGTRYVLMYWKSTSIKRR